MTRGQKFLTWLIVEGALVGAGAAGGIYWYQRRDKTPAQLKECQDGRKQLDVSAKNLYIRNLLLEAEIGLHRGSAGFAFERVVRADTAAQAHRPELKKDFAELSSLLLTQDPQAKVQLLTLAEKVVPFGPPPEPPKVAAAPSAASAKPAGASAAPGAGGVGGTGQGTVAPAAAAGAAAAAPPSAAAAPAARVPTAAPLAAAPSEAAGTTAAQEEAYRAVLDAKTELLAGGTGAVSKLARARVMVDEAGRTDVASDLDAALAAAKRKDEGKAKAAMDAALTSLRRR